MSSFDWSKYSPAKTQAQPVEFDWSKYRAANTTPQKKSPSTWDLLTNPYEQWKMARDFVGSGIVNPLINFINLGPEAERAVASKYGLPQLPNIPNMKTDPHSWSSFLGNFLGYGIPVAGTERGLAKAAEIAPEFFGKNLILGPMGRLLTASSAASAAVSPEGERAKNALYGLLGGTAGGAISKAGSAVAKGIGAAIPKEIIKEAPQELTEGFQGSMEGTPSEAHQTLQNAYQNAWNKANEYSNSIKMASDIDSKYPGVKPKFNNLIDEAKQIKQEVQGESGNVQSDYDSAMPYVDRLINNPPKTYEGLVKERQSFNKFYQKNPNPTVDEKNTIERLKSSLDEQIANHGETNPDIANFLNDWKRKTADYAAAKQFSNKENFSGANSKSLNEALSGNENAFNSIFASPSSSRSMLSNWKNYAKLTGLPEEDAKQLLKAHYFRDSFDKKASDNLQDYAINQYRKLSPSDRNWLLTKDEQNLLENASRAKQAIKDLKLDKGKGVYPTIARSIGKFALGSGIGHFAGASPEISALLGYLAAGSKPSSIANMAAKSRLKPGSVENALNYFARQGPQANRGNLGVPVGSSAMINLMNLISGRQ